jgi:hypothetical protein
MHLSVTTARTSVGQFLIIKKKSTRMILAVLDAIALQTLRIESLKITDYISQLILLLFDIQK